MVSSDLLDVVLGVVLAWFLLSLVTSLLGESLAWLTRARSKLLWQSLSQLFDAGIDAADARVRTMMWRIPGATDDLRPAATTAPTVASSLQERSKRGPADAPQQTTELYELIQRRVPEPAPRSLRSRISHVPTTVVGDAFEALAARTVTKASLFAAARPGPLADSLAALTGGPVSKEEAQSVVPEALHTDLDTAWEGAERIVTVDDLEALLASNPELLARVKSAVRDVAGGEVATRARAEVERWFDGAMDALSRFYRRQNRKILALIAVPVVLLANSGAFGLVDRLQDDQDLRAAASSDATDWAAIVLNETEQGRVDLDEACTRINDDTTTTTTTPVTASTDVSTPPDPIDEARRRYRCASELFASSELLGPVGPAALWREIGTGSDRDNPAYDLAGWLFSLDFAGRVVTWLALLFGASFWYDVLRRLVGLKTTLTSKTRT